MYAHLLVVVVSQIHVLHGLYDYSKEQQTLLGSEYIWIQVVLTQISA